MRFKIWFLIVFFPFQLIFGQDQDSTQTAKPEKKSAQVTFQGETGDEPKVFELIFSRSFLIGAGNLDSVPLSTFNSGSYRLGAGFRIPFQRNTIGLRIAPSVTWLRLVYNQSENKTFPTLADTTRPELSQERHQLTYLDLPLSFYYNITKDEDSDPLLFVEIGGYAGYMLGGNYKQRYDDGDLRVTQKLSGLPQLEGQFERFRYGVMARVGYKWFSIYGNLRLTRVFGEFTNPQISPRPDAPFRNPEITGLELGISLVL
jgi:hypothetical protein